MSLEAFLSESGEQDFLTQLECAESGEPCTQLEFRVFDHLISISRMAAKITGNKSIFADVLTYHIECP